MAANSQLNIRAELTRLRQASAGRRGNDALAGPVSFEQTLTNAISSIQDAVNGINERLAAIEARLTAGGL